ncbi:MAG: amidohydrolase family protein, partial [Vicinamibacterales bacterium]
MSTILLRSLIFVCVSLAATSMATVAQEPFDLVVAGGRVIDPESGLDAIQHLGIRDDRVVEMSGKPLSGRDVLDAGGLVVAPGFIDLHRHAHGDISYRYAARDGVTSVFELEIGTPDVDAWYRMLGPARLINFGVAAGHIGARMQVLGDKGFLLPTGPGRGPASPSQIAEIVSLVENGLVAGAVAVGIGTAYTPGASAEEIAGVLNMAARQGAFVHAHLGSGLKSLESMLNLAEQARSPLHIAHINSTAGDEVRRWLDLIQTARRGHADVTTEMYPYTAGATLIQSALYDGWESWPDQRFARLQW